MKIINKRNAYLGKKVKLIEFSFFTYEVLNEMKINGFNDEQKKHNCH